MDKIFTQDQKNTYSYILLDLTVSILLFVAFNYKSINPALGIAVLSFIPVCFLIYSIPLKYNIKYYSIFSALTLSYLFFFTWNFNRSEALIGIKDINALLYLIIGMLIFYSIYVITQILISSNVKY